MADVNKIDRRVFLQIMAASGTGFLIGCSPAQDGATPAPKIDTAKMGHFIRISTDNTVTVIVKHLDKGQGVTTGLPTIVAEELDADWSQMRAEFAPANASIYNHLFLGQIQTTGGSTSIANSWMQLRTAAAGARAMLVSAAASAWQVAADEITIKRGVVSHAKSHRSATFGELAPRAGELEAPAEPILKDPKDFTLIGGHVPRIDSGIKTDGTAVFTLDFELPNMVMATVARPPNFGGSVKSFDPTAALAINGVLDVVQIERGVAVVADSYWTAQKGRKALQIEWDLADAETRGTEQMFSDYKALTSNPGNPARNDGDAVSAMQGAHKTTTREMYFPFLSHAPMEPMDCVVQLGPDACEIWTGSQSPTFDQNRAAEILDLSPDQVAVNTLYAGGSFGRRAVPDSDFVAEAVMIAKAIGGRAPVKLHWSREDDMQGGRYRPMSYHRLEGAIDEAGKITAWRHNIASQSFLQGTQFAAFIRDGIDGTAVEGARNLPYDIPNVKVNLHLANNGVPGLWWRSVGHSHNAYATEVFFDELAHLADRDPYELRLELLKDHPRYIAVLKLAAEKANWSESLGAGHGRGIAVHETFGTYVAQVVDVTVTDGLLSVDRVVCAVDCGVAINPDIINAQMQGCIAYGLSAALREEITLHDGVVEQSNFDKYMCLRIDEMPTVDVHIVASDEAPRGVGEPGVPPLAPALANAIFAATGTRITRLPIGTQLQG